MAISQTIGQLIGPSLIDSDYREPLTGASSFDKDEPIFNGYKQYSMNFGENLNPGSAGNTFYFKDIQFPRHDSLSIDYLVFLSQKQDITDPESHYLQVQDIYVTPSGSEVSYFTSSFGFTITTSGYKYIIIVVKSDLSGTSIPDKPDPDYEGSTRTTYDVFENSFQSNGYKIKQDKLPGAKWKKIGIQADPGFVFFINGEPIMVGRSGFAETPDDYMISAVGFLNNQFICDYYIDTTV